CANGFDLVARSRGSDFVLDAHCLIGNNLWPLDVVRWRSGTHGLPDFCHSALFTASNRKQLNWATDCWKHVFVLAVWRMDFSGTARLTFTTWKRIPHRERICFQIPAFPGISRFRVSVRGLLIIMDWVTAIWAMLIGACVATAVPHLLLAIWQRRRRGA